MKCKNSKNKYTAKNVVRKANGGKIWKLWVKNEEKVYSVSPLNLAPAASSA